jgi:outer membrane receptor protein involved in Fe transport
MIVITRTGVPLPVLLAVLGSALLAPFLVAAQERGAVEGVITDVRSGVPIADADITVEGVLEAARSGPDGHFVLLDVPTGTTLLRVNAPGYARLVEEIRVDGDGILRLQVQLLSMAATLSEVLVTGDRGGASLETLRSPEVRTAADLLSRRIPGMGTASYGGEVGGRERLLLRGVSSLSLGNEPAIYLDGLRIFGGGDGSQEMAQVLRLLEAIPAENVRRLEVLRGPSARASLGETATGAIVIETRGTPQE